MDRKTAKKLAKETGKIQKVTEFESIDEAKIQVSVRIDLSVLNEIKRQADERGIPYTTLLNSMLKQHLVSEASVEARLERIEKELKIAK